jgi:hypothetical protein
MRRVFAQKPTVPASQEWAARSACRGLRGSLVGNGLISHGIWRCFSMVGGLLSWVASRRGALADFDERSVEQYLRHRAEKLIQPGDRSALKRWLSVLRAEGVIAPAVQPHLTSHDRVFNEFDAYPRTELGCRTEFGLTIASADSRLPRRIRLWDTAYG